MLSVKNYLGGSSGGGSGADTSIWSETWYPQRGIARPTDLYRNFYVVDMPDLHKDVNTRTGEAIPAVFNTETASANPFVKAVLGYTSASVPITYN